MPAEFCVLFQKASSRIGLYTYNLCGGRNGEGLKQEARRRGRQDVDDEANT